MVDAGRGVLVSGSFNRRFTVQVHWLTERRATFGWSKYLPKRDRPVKLLRLNMGKVSLMITSRGMP